MEVLTDTTFKAKVCDYEAQPEWKFRGSRPAIIDFYADWCAPCRALAPIFEQVASRYAGRVDFYKIDTEASPELADLFGIRSIPSLLFIPLEGEPAMNFGLIQEDGFERAINDLFGIAKA